MLCFFFQGEDGIRDDLVTGVQTCALPILYKSTDEGITWTQITGSGLPAGDWGRSGIAAAPGNHGQRVYLILEAKEKAGGLYRSDDAGASWKKATEDKRIQGYWYMSEIFADPKNPEVVYVPSQNQSRY